MSDDDHDWGSDHESSEHIEHIKKKITKLTMMSSASARNTKSASRKKIQNKRSSRADSDEEEEHGKAATTDSDDDDSDDDNGRKRRTNAVSDDHRDEDDADDEEVGKNSDEEDDVVEQDDDEVEEEDDSDEDDLGIDEEEEEEEEEEESDTDEEETDVEAGKEKGPTSTDSGIMPLKHGKPNKSKRARQPVHYDDEDDEDETYLQKFDKEITKKYMSSFHPECISHSSEEIQLMCQVVRNERGVIIDPLHKTIPFLTKYEKARILGQRAKQIECGAKPFVRVHRFNGNIIDSYVIAEMELKAKRIPFIIKRPLPHGGFEYWRLNDLEYINF